MVFFSAGLVVKKTIQVLRFIFTTEGSMSAQRAQRECSCSLGVQEFRGFFALLCGSLCGLCVKKRLQALIPSLVHHFLIN